MGHVVQTDPELMVIERARTQKRFIKLVHHLVDRMDANGDDAISLYEFRESLRHDVEVQNLFRAMDLEIGDSEFLYRILDDGDGNIDAEKLSYGLRRITSPARSIDITA